MDPHQSPLEQRERAFDRLTHSHWDVLVVGGGISGAGIAWQLSRWGVSVALVEQNDYASGTSSRSSKMIHGGFRYLPHGELGLVRQVSRERTRLARLMPHLISPLPMTIPAYRGGPFPLWALALGSGIYDRLGRIDATMAHRRLDPRSVKQRAPGIREDNLQGGIAYFEFGGLDARINWAVIATAAQQGVLALNYVRALFDQSTLKANGPSSVAVEDRLRGRMGTVEAQVVVNAAGPWADQLDRESHLVRSRGIHLVFPRKKFPLDFATILPTPENANIFAVPRGPVTYLGTTDNPDTSSIENPDLVAEDAQYLLGVANRLFPRLNLKLADVIAAWSGVRPLIAQDREARTDRLSRRDLVVARPSLVTVLGGKFTGFRATAENVAQTVLERLGGASKAARPESIADAPRGEQITALQTVLDQAGVSWAVARYGTRSLEWLAWARDRGHDALEPVLANVPLVQADIDWEILFEDARSVADVLIRRTGLAWLGGLRPEAVREMARRTAERMRIWLQWSADETERQIRDFWHTGYFDDVVKWNQTH
ncbi:glycerol-3-phosphate dehydrogenase/oxidase [Sulfobacillus harzensis]|uniref:Glycerol-3-phosphate dehydrogenase/oxidase n=1 Tax=Sulfobacillus harzensis TaxID=2729629 RepID=A0A7Y0L4F9_9FIRM|nr:glycerol-3-phosphate dehydrogenase/oxidase [Sulfobacillus harzensis]NMP23123.1 glycerol-3-phosphate dehydrogenase/oxidase [Sulfobacillus harzensis]